MTKIGILGVGSFPTSPHWDEQKRKIYEDLGDKYILRSEEAEPFQADDDIAPVMLPPEPIPFKLCKFYPKPIPRGRGRSVMNEEHYQKQIAKRRKKNKNKKAHRK